jgi:hypothetical protein
VRGRGGRKRAIGTPAPLELPHGINQRWSLDFVSDTRADAAASEFYASHCFLEPAAIPVCDSRSATARGPARVDARVPACHPGACADNAAFNGRFH